MIAAIDPNAEMGPTGMFVGASFLALVACGTLVSGLHPRWRATAKWTGGVSRSLLGSAAFTIGLLIMSAGLIVRGVLNQHGALAGVALWFFAGGGAVLILGPLFDLIQSVRRR